MATVEEMLVVIDATTERLRREMRGADQQVATFVNRANQNMGRFDRMMTQAQRSADRLAGRLRGLVLAWAGMRTFTVGRQMIEFADQIGVAAERLSVTAEQLQVFRYAAEDAANIGVQQADIALQRFSRRVAEAAQGTGTLLSVTQRYGIQLRDSEGRLRPIMDILRDYADAVASAESGQEQLRMAFRAFDSEGSGLVNVLRQGAAGWDSFEAAARRAGILTNDQVREAQRLDSEFTRLSSTIRTNLTQVFIDIGPVIVDFLNLLRVAAAVAREVVSTVRMLGHGGTPATGSLEMYMEREIFPRLNLTDVEQQTRALGELNVMLGTTFRSYQELQQALAAEFASPDLGPLERRIEQLARGGAPAAIGDGGGGGGVGSVRQAPSTVDRVTEAIERQITSLALQRIEVQLGAEAAEHARIHWEYLQAALEDGIDPELVAGQADEMADRVIDAMARLADADELRRFQDEAERLVEQALGGTERQARLTEAAIAILNARFDEGSLSVEDYTAALDRLRTGELTDFERQMQQLGETVGSAFEEAILQGRDLRDVLRGLLDDLARMAWRGLVMPGVGSLFNSAFGNLFGGGKAAGGPVRPGMVYEVGEAGRELFAPEVPGSILPKGAADRLLGGGGERHLYFDFRGADPSVTPKLEALARELARLDGSLEDRAVAAGDAARRRDPIVHRYG